MSRIIERPGRNRIDDESFEFHNRVRKSYLSLYKKQGNRIFLIDGEKSINDVQRDIRKILKSRFSIFKRLEKFDSGPSTTDGLIITVFLKFIRDFSSPANFDL